MRRLWLTAICATLLGLGAPAPAQGAFDDPLFFFTPQPPPPPEPLVPPPTGYLDGPCGLTVDASGNFYVSDYYHRAVDVFGSIVSQPLSAWTGGGENPHTGMVDDPCGLALGGSGTLYLNNYHRNVVRFPTPVSLTNPNNKVIDSGDPSNPYANPTGVAVDPSTNTVYVDDRTYLAEYSSTGVFIRKIGEGTLQDGYGIAVSGYSLTSGYLYVPDAATKTVKVYDPATDTVNPIASLTRPGGFGSLLDSSVAVDNATGEVYVVDTIGPQLSERPQAIVYVFDATGSFEGRLKHATINAAPTGLAVDNSAGSTQGQVYVTSGIADNASIYGYPSGAATSASAPPLVFIPAASSNGQTAASSVGGESSALAGQGQAPALAHDSAQATTSAISQQGNLRVAVSGELKPKRLPRSGLAPISVSVGGEITTTDESLPPQLKALRIELNRHGRLDYRGLPTCEYAKIQPGSSGRALAGCRSALVGKGSFSAEITLAGQEPYSSEGKLLVFNSIRGGKPVLYGHIYSPRPFATSFVIVFEVARLRKGTYGITLNAPLPAAMKAWGRLTSIEMTLSRRFHYQGRSHSYISSGCPAPEGFPGAIFPLARASFAFVGGQELSSVLSSTCKARG